MDCPFNQKSKFVVWGFSKEEVQLAREEKGWGRRFFLQIEPNLPTAIQYRASTMVEGCQGGGLGHLLQYMREKREQCREPIIYLWVSPSFADLNLSLLL